MASPPQPAEDTLPGALLERLVHPEPARIREALGALQAMVAERRQDELALQPLASGNPAGGLADPSVRGWNWGAFLAGPLWAAAHRLPLLGLLLVLLFWSFPLPNLALGRFGGQMAWRQRRFADVGQFAAVQRAWALAGLVIFPLQMALLVGLLVYLGGR